MVAQTEKIDIKAKIYVLAIFFLWIFLFYLVLRGNKLTDWQIILTWIILQFSLESFDIDLKKSATISISFATLFAAIILFGPLNAGVIALFQGITWKDLVALKNISITKWVFNSFQASICAITAGLIYKSLGGLIFTNTHSAFHINNFASQVLPLLFAIIAYYLTNTLLVSLAIALNEKTPLRELWTINFYSIYLNYLALGFLGIIFAQIYFLQPFALILVIVPLVISRQTFSRYMKLEKAYTETVGALVKAIEAKDKYTRGHSERVAALSVKIARKLNLPEDQVEDLGRIATLHDIGKIGIPKKILDKPDKLSDEEFLKIKEHPKIGAKILKDVPFLQDLIPAVYYHHEKFDGSGYASGLSGSNIPLFARIIAIADSYDAMTSDRAYRKAMTDQKVMDQLLTNSGSQFDAKIVQALLEVLDIKIDEKKKSRLQTAPNFS